MREELQEFSRDTKFEGLYSGGVGAELVPPIERRSAPADTASSSCTPRRVCTEVTELQDFRRI